MFMLLCMRIGSTAITNTAFEQGSGPVLLHNVACSSFEHTLLDCPNGGFELNSCVHTQDAAVVCRTGELIVTFIL